MSDDETRRLIAEYEAKRQAEMAELAAKIDRQQRDERPLTMAIAAENQRRGYQQNAEARAAAKTAAQEGAAQEGDDE
jgi:hypothetical protein